ncbi:MAG: 6-phosphofructokinase [Deltaproteobacteria bacterium]|nr:6-phosphofructokinase [Deltaproteobacteria bacterium]
MKVGVLTGGGDCPGLNAVIRAVVKLADNYGYEVIGIKDGWKGLVSNSTILLTENMTSDILSKGGTILGTSRTNPFKDEKTAEKAIENIKGLGLDCIICIGGNDTLGAASKLYNRGIKTIGVPKTIDNDLSGTDFTFGFDTAVSIVSDAMDRLRTTTEAHHRIMVVEVMGRHAGWIATFGGLAGGADMILIPEKPFDINDIVCRVNKYYKTEGRYSMIIVVAEGAKPINMEGYITKDMKMDEFGNVMLGGIGDFLAKVIEKNTGVETRHVVLGHLQRGGSPTAYDRILATRYGIKAVELIKEGKFGRMVALNGSKIVDIPIEEGVKETKTVDMDTYRIIDIFSS